MKAIILATALLVMMLSGCQFAGSKISPRQVDCTAVCTPDKQFIECKGISEGYDNTEMSVQGQ